jgi:hypothetical protein
LNDYEKGVSLNVGMISGGKAVNVVPGECTIHIDLRFLKNEDGEEADRYIKGLEPQLKGAEILIEGGLRRPPIIQNERNKKLWKLAKECAKQLDLSIEQGLSGGGSDGSITSQFTATIDGMGPVGEGAHSPSERDFSSRDYWIELHCLRRCYWRMMLGDIRTAYGIRTRVTAVKGRRPKPLDERGLSVKCEVISKAVFRASRFCDELNTLNKKWEPDGN